MNSQQPETGQITLRLKLDIIKSLRILAVMRDASLNAIAEDFFLEGGLHATVDRELNRDGMEREKVVLNEPCEPAAIATVFQSTLHPGGVQKALEERGALGFSLDNKIIEKTDDKDDIPW